MPRTAADSEAWKRIVLKSMPLPAWLSLDGPHRSIVLSTRVRFMRNLRGHRFPHAADGFELQEIAEKILGCFSDKDVEILRSASPAERDYLVACRLVSPDFDWRSPGRALILDRARAVSIMVNEEDHLRMQSLIPGWSFAAALSEAEALPGIVEQRIEFARNEEFGYLASSPSNCGEGRRYSAMFHLIGLAQQKKLATVIRALMSQGLIVRGLFGERSRAIGAFLQLSTTASSVPHFVGAAEYLLEEESRARAGCPQAVFHTKVTEARGFVETSKGISLADALRALAWIRWERCGSGADAGGPRSVDAVLPELALLESLEEPRAGRSRVETLRRVFAA